MKSIKLKTALIANAIFSSASGIAMLMFGPSLAEMMGIGNSWILPLIGVGLVVFAATILFHSTRPTISTFQVKLIIAQDLAWVVGSLIIVLLGLFGLTQTAYLVIGILALVVLDFAYLQWVGLKNYRSVGS